MDVEFTDDDESFVEIIEPQDETIVLSSDKENEESDIISSDEDLPCVKLADIQQKKSALIKNLFPSSNKIQNDAGPTTAASSSKLKDFKRVPPPSLSFRSPEKPKDPGINRMIEGVNVNLPVNPYGCQVALMSMLIKAIKRGQNCLLESPTGSGKTLALLCAALGWLSNEKKAKAELQAQNYFTAHPELNQVHGAMDYVTSPIKQPPGAPEKFFTKNTFGEKSIYDKPDENIDTLNLKRQEPFSSFESDSPEKGQVRIHKKRKFGVDSSPQSSSNSEQVTPKKINQPDPDSPNLRSLIDNLHIRTSMLVDSSVPTIYYGARTHKQLQQVIAEFGRTSYCDSMKMTILSSREYSCIREYDKKMWPSKNDMCRGCVKKIIPKDDTHRTRDETNCKYYDNRAALKHERLPSAFDLEDLVNFGQELTACPYFAAREMAATADIVFCPYNYLIEPSIRSSMRINLEDNIVIVDEAHNIEDICRDAATFTFTRENIQSALKELDVVSQYRYSAPNQDVLNDIDRLTLVMKNWDDWFRNQSQLVENRSVSNGEAVYPWETDHFLKSLDHHNIGKQQYPEFHESAMKFCNQLQNDPRTLFGVTQSTGTLVESIDTALGYFFRENGKYKDDFKPMLVKIITGDTDGVTSWRNSQFKKMTESEALSLRLYCMNPAVVFSSLKVAKCIILASGTLTPLISLHSELDTEFPLKISPNHVIPPDRVWIGTLSTHRDGRPLTCKSTDTNQPDTQDSLGEAVLWVCRVTPHGVLCFLPSYLLMNKLIKRWQDTGIWKQLQDHKHVFEESRNVRDHNDIMEDYYKYVSTDKGALLLAVYRGKVSEGMDFKDHQARAVITIGVPYPNTYDMAVKAKMQFNDKYSRQRNLLTGQQWIKVQAYRALNQAVGRCVRHKADWGAVLLIDARFQNKMYTEHLSKWVNRFLENNHHSFESLVNSANGLETFMQSMTIRENEDT